MLNIGFSAESGFWTSIWESGQDAEVPPLGMGTFSDSGPWSGTGCYNYTLPYCSLNTIGKWRIGNSWCPNKIIRWIGFQFQMSILLVSYTLQNSKLTHIWYLSCLLRNAVVLFRPRRLHTKLEPTSVKYDGVIKKFKVEKFIKENA